MLRNYLRIALRNLLRHKAHSFVNVFGLAVSMAVCLLILLFLRDQMRYDAFHANADHIYRVNSEYRAAINPDKQLYAMSPAGLGEVLQTETQEVEQVVQIRTGFGGLASYEGYTLRLSGFFTDPAFFDVFSFRLARGDARTALAAPYRLVLTEEAASRFFGTGDPLGKALTLGEGEDAVTYTVTGVLAQPPFRTHFPLEAIASLTTVRQSADFNERLSNWTRSIYQWYNYVLLRGNASPAALKDQFPAIIAQHYSPREQNVLHALQLQSIQEINLGPVMGNQLGPTLPNVIAYFLSALAFVIVLVACFNYVGLTVARSLRRAREVGVRKVIGAHRGQVIVQFLVEAFVVVLLALGLTCALIVWLLPAFNSLWFIASTGTELSVDPIGDGGLYLVLLSFAVLVALAAGLYPAIYLSRFLPVTAVKGEVRAAPRGRITLRKTLIVVQFAVALFLVVTGTLIYQQSVLMLNTDYGFDKERIINVDLQGVPYEIFRNEAIALPGVENVSATSLLPVVDGRSDAWLTRPGMDEPVKAYTYAVDTEFIENLGLRILAGRGFSSEFATDSAGAVIVNQTALRELNLGAPSNAVGRIISVGNQPRAEIVGVVADYQSNQMPALQGTSPVVLTYSPEQLQWANVRVESGGADAVIAQLKNVWEEFNRPTPLEYGVFSIQLSETPDLLQFQDLQYMIGLISVLALVIACLGLLGAAAYSAQARTKEVGIRKVHGARVRQIVALLSRDFAVLLVIAVVIAVPPAWFVNDMWLSQFVDRVAISPLVLAGGALGMLLVALGAVGSQTVRAALADPVKTLRYE